MGQALEDVGWKRPTTSASNAFAEWMYIDFEIGQSGDFSSFNYFVSDLTNTHFGLEEILISDKRGFSCLTDYMYSMIDPERVILGQIIDSVDTSGGNVVIKTQSGRMYTGKSVLITVSIGVLKAGTIRFRPELPAWKATAIANTSMASYTKVFIQWEKRWWDDLVDNPESTHKRNLFTVLLDKEDEQTKWRIFSDLLPQGK